MRRELQNKDSVINNLKERLLHLEDKVNIIQRDEKREKSQQKIKSSIKQLEACLKLFMQDHDNIHNSSIMRDDHLASIASAISMKSLHESDTCNSLETIPFLSTHREFKENVNQNIGPAKLENEEDELLKELINIENEPNCGEEGADSSLLLLANEWE